MRLSPSLIKRRRWKSLPKLKVSVRKVGNNIQKQLKKLYQLHQQKVEVGHFKEQGVHSTAGISYADLMRKHHNGYELGGTKVPARPVLTVLNFRLGGVGKSLVKTYLRQWSKTPVTPQSNMLLLDNIGKDVREMEKSIFGVASEFMPSNSSLTISLKGGQNTPLVDTEELLDATAYKTSLGNKVVT